MEYIFSVMYYPKYANKMIFYIYGHKIMI